MKCPNCGAQIPINSLYCETCGEDIHIVPNIDFNDLDIQDTMDGILEHITDEANTIRIDEQEAKKQSLRKDKKRKRMLLRAGILAFVLLLVLGATGILKWKQYHSVSYQLSKAEDCVKRQDYQQAINYYNRVLELDYTNIQAKFDLAEVYFQVNNKVEYEYLMRDIVTDENATTEQLITAYGKLIGIYRGKDEYQTIHNILSFCKNETVLNTYSDYVALPPRFSLGDGYYTKVEPLTISGQSNGKIYYTLDGNEPDIYSIEYTAPIILEEGEYEIKARYINQNGIKSDVAVAKYHVEIEYLPAPIVNVLNGQYEHPVNIEIMGDSTDVYYTVDGSRPSVESLKYEGPIPMPLGVSHFRFIQVKGNKVSEITDLEISLEMNGGLSTVEAEVKAMEYAMSIQRVTAPDGSVEGSPARYSYSFCYPISVEEQGDFYVLEEKLFQNDYAPVSTGNLFAVNIYSGIIYGLQIDEYHNYSLIDLFEEEEDAEEGAER